MYFPTNEAYQAHSKVVIGDGVIDRAAYGTIIYLPCPESDQLHIKEGNFDVVSEGFTLRLLIIDAESLSSFSCYLHQFPSKAYLTL